MFRKQSQKHYNNHTIIHLLHFQFYRTFHVVTVWEITFSGTQWHEVYKVLFNNSNPNPNPDPNPRFARKFVTATFYMLQFHINRQKSPGDSESWWWRKITANRHDHGIHGYLKFVIFTWTLLLTLKYTKMYKQESPAVADKPARRFLEDCSVWCWCFFVWMCNGVRSYNTVPLVTFSTRAWDRLRRT